MVLATLGMMIGVKEGAGDQKGHDRFFCSVSHFLVHRLNLYKMQKTRGVHFF